MGSCSSTEFPPWSLGASSLESWHNANIQEGTAVFDNECREAIDWVVRYLHGKCSSNKDLFDVAQIVKGGSLGKGTMVQDKSDVDLVAFINPPHMKPMRECQSADEYRNQLKVVLEALKNALNRTNKVAVKRTDAHLVNFDLLVHKRRISVDLLPTADNFFGYALGPHDIFEEMLQVASGYDRVFYLASLVKFQRDFVNEQPVYVKELIRLVKFWAYTKLPDNLQKSYPLELITIYRWEMAGKPARFSKAQGLKDVLESLKDLQGLRHYWTDYYNKEMAERAITKIGHRKPILLDPGNPTNNVCWVYQRGENMEQIANAVNATLESTLMRSVDEGWGKN